MTTARGVAAAWSRLGGPAPLSLVQEMASAMSLRGRAALRFGGEDPVALCELRPVEPGGAGRAFDDADEARRPATGRSGCMAVDAVGRPAADSTLWAAVHARIHNRTELRRAGLVFGDAASDSDLILRAYRRWGPQCAAWLLGDFAFVIWDAARRQLFCARDQLGAHPLFYQLRRDRFACASDASALRAAQDGGAGPNAAAIGLFVLEEYREDGDSLYETIRVLPAAHSLLVTDRSTRLERFWTPSPRYCEVRAGEDELAERVASTLTQAVEARLAREGRTGVELSGGMDSSSLCAIASKVSAVPPVAMHLAFRGLPCDETMYAESVANHLGVPLLMMDGGSADSTRPRLLPEQPDLLYVPSHTCFGGLMAAAGQRGITTVLTGIGGDQLFDETRVECAQALRDRNLRLAIEIVGFDRNPLSLLPARLFWQRGIKPLVPEPWRRATRAIRHVGLRRSEPLLGGKAFLRAMDHVFDRMRHEAAQPFPDLVTRRLREELVRFTTCVPIAQAEQLGTHAGLDVSHPFLDVRVVELMLAMPYVVRLRRGVLKAKPLLRRAMRGQLPPKVLARQDAADSSPITRSALFVDHRAALEPLFDGACRLADLGIVDPAAVRHALSTADDSLERRLSVIVALELWLRSAWS